jgi:serine/threonine protein kinase/WD40 repeat protein/energy-coupling factor transporter ATP-binding protein EcfA2
MSVPSNQSTQQSSQQIIKGYQLQNLIDEGGFGAVYKAYQTTVGREVAIKIILPAHANQPDFIRRFEGEAQLVARLEHPHITPLYDYWRDPDGAYLVMRWLRGGSLRDALKNGVFELRATALLLDQIAGALSLAHRNQVIHRDIKPGNILLDEDGNAYLTDFGIAKDLNLSGNHTERDSIVGSLDYISPEQARSEPVTPRTDIYSLGVTLYEMLTGHHPFQNVSPIERLYKHINDPLPDITSLDPQYQTEINRVIQKATAKDPQNRYPDALAFAADFREAIGMNRTSTTMVELLTQREHDILNLIIEGLSNKEIAQRLTVTLSTVKWYVNQIYAKLGVRSRVQAIVRARELNLLVRSDGAVEVVSVPTEEFFPENPYKGLRAFHTADYQDFFGREKLTDRLVQKMGETGDYSRFLAVVGPSGSGKSSLVKAGLIPALWRGDLPSSEKWFIVEMLPGSRPTDELEVALTKIAAEQSINLHEHLSRDAFGLVRAAQLILPNDNSELVLVIDQFEEVYTLVEDTNARQHFLNLLIEAVTQVRSRVRVVITLRADFYDRPLHDPRFGELVRHRLETIMPLSAEELDRAITQPAQRVGVLFEQGLVASIIGDINYQAGALPLLQYALTELFEQRNGRMLTREAYQAIGGTTGALAKRAEDIYQQMDTAQQTLTRQIFLRLVTLGEGTEDTRRRTPRAELQAIHPDNEAIDEILDTFSAYRLLALDNDPNTRNPTVEVAHEALLREWDRLRAWLNDSREDVRQERQVALATADWQKAKQDESYLLTGSRLEQVENWYTHSSITLLPTEKEFIQTSLQTRERKKQLDSERKANEIRLEKRSQTFLRGLVAVLALATLGGFILSGFAITRGNEAIEAREYAESQVRIAQARELVGYSEDTLETDGELSTLLALEAVNMTFATDGVVLPEAETVLHQAVQGLRTPVIVAPVDYFAGDVLQFAFTPDGRRIIHVRKLDSESVSMAVSDALTGQELYPLTGFPLVDSAPNDRFINLGFTEDVGFIAQVWDVSAENGGTLIESVLLPLKEFDIDWIDISLDLRYLNTWSQSRGTEVFEISTGKQVFLDFSSPMYRGDATFSWDGSLIANRNPDASISIYDIVTGSQKFVFRRLGIGLLPIEFRFSADSQYLVVANGDESISVLNLTTGEEKNFITDFLPEIVALSANGSQVAGASRSGEIIVWNTATGTEVARLSASEIDRMNFSPDGTKLATQQAGAIYIWDLAIGREVLTVISSEFNADGGATGIDYSPDGTHLVTASVSNTPIVFDAQTGIKTFTLEGHTERVVTVDWSADGSMIASGGEDTNVILWNATTGEQIRTISGHSDLIYSVAFSPDNTHIASSSFDKTMRIWEVATGKLVHLFTRIEASKGVAWSPDGLRIASSTNDVDDLNAYLQVWDAVTGVEQLKTPLGPARSGIVAFSPDGKQIAVGMQEIHLAYLIDSTSGKILFSLEEHLSNVPGVAYSPDGTMVATTGYNEDKRLIIWDTATGKQLTTILTKSGVARVVFSPDGKYIASINMDGTARIYFVHVEDLIALAESRLTRTWAVDECKKYLHTETCPQVGN